MRLRKASMLRLPHSSQVWLRIRCRLVIREQSSLPLLARHPGYQPKLPPNVPLLSPKGLHLHHAQLAPRYRRQHAKAESRSNLKPTKVQISDADCRREIRITDKCTMAFEKWRDKGESFRVDRYRCISGRCLYQIISAKPKVTKTKTALKQETYNLSDLKHDLRCGFVELGDSVSLSL